MKVHKFLLLSSIISLTGFTVFFSNQYWTQEIEIPVEILILDQKNKPVSGKKFIIVDAFETDPDFVEQPVFSGNTDEDRGLLTFHIKGKYKPYTKRHADAFGRVEIDFQYNFKILIKDRKTGKKNEICSFENSHPSELKHFKVVTTLRGNCVLPNLP